MLEQRDDSTIVLTAYKIPLSVIAEWPTPNYINPTKRIWAAPFSIVLMVISTLVVAARIYARTTRTAGAFGLDDILIILAWLFAVLFTAAASYGVLRGGFDLHVWDVPPSLAAKGGFVAWMGEGCFLASSALTKVSILLFYRRLVDRAYGRVMQWAIYAAIAFSFAYLAAFLLFLVFVCSPTSATWLSLSITYSQPYKCAPRNVVDPLVGALSVFSDVYSLAIPEIVVSSMKLPWRQKVALYGIFSTGLLVVGAGVARTVWLARLSTDRLRDLTWVGFEVFVWTEVEMQLAMICASAPALKAFCGRFLRDHFSKASRSRTYATNDSMPLKTITTTATFNTRPVSVGSGGSTITTWPMLGDKEIMVTESFSVQPVDVDTEEGQLVVEAMHKERRVLGI